MALWALWAALVGCAGTNEITDAPAAEVCANGVDDDDNGLVDCADNACSEDCSEQCGNAFDDDADGAIDCADSDCDGSCVEACDDGRDNDGDAAIDCADNDCDGACAENCADGRDNDLDGETDCADVDCDGSCPELCDDGRDNDGNGAIDCADGACAALCDADGDGAVAESRGGDDCDDGNGAVHPGATELCNGVDDDCNDLVDDADPGIDPSSAVPVWADGDGDGWGGAPVGAFCVPPAGTSAQEGDCDDGNDAVHPDGIEVCNGSDDDCDNLVDDGDPDVDLGTASNWFTDLDGDGYGQFFAGRTCAAPPYGTLASGDCDDADDAVHPAADEVCNAGVDDDCDLLADDADPGLDPASAIAWYADNDSDGYGVLFVDLACEPPPDAADASGDCNDANDAIHPGADELCNGKVDDDCDALADDADPSLDADSATAWHADDDDDGYGGDVVDIACVAPVDTLADGTDCDDGDAAIHPGGDEVCNDGIDDDCDALVDDADPSLDLATRTVWYRDVDGDEYGTVVVVATACAEPASAAANNDDCNDGNVAINPDATEVCNANVDDDCDGLADSADPTLDPSTAVASWDDDDRDGFGDPAGPHVACTVALGDVTNDEDCDDGNDEIHPAATEVCNANVDDDCDGLKDDADPSTDPSSEIAWWTDADNDNYGNPALPGSSCVIPANGSPNDDDCDDTDRDISPADVEACDTIDNDCDGLVDDDDPSVAIDLRPWYPDVDGDGLGDATGEVMSCLPPLDFVADGTDCDDLDPLVGAPGPWARDLDADGFGNPTVASCDAPAAGWVPVDVATDCDDGDPDVNPGALEVCNGGTDDDCDDLADDDDPDVDLTTGIAWWRDIDLDRYGDPDGATGLVCEISAGIADNPDDCDDSDGDVNPGEVEVCNGGVDDDCNGASDDADGAIGQTIWYVDADSDGVGNAAVSVLACAAPFGFVAASGDCDDADPGVGAPSVWGVDADADGFSPAPITACAPGLGMVSLATDDVDCNDGDAGVHPDAEDICADGIDQDCRDGDDDCVAVLVGRFRITDGPSWTEDPPTYSCVEACALLFGGVSTDYGCGLNGAGVTHQAYLDGYADDTYCTSPRSDTYKKNTHYDCGALGCSYSTYVTDHACTNYNYCYAL